jgi:outer membrane protein assembly factor BamD (BamD/ComL family)
MLRPLLAAIGVMLLALPPAAAGQHSAFILTDEGEWTEVRAPSDPDEALLAEAAQLIHDGHPGRARKMLSRWIDENNFTDNPWLPTALRLRGDAKVADGNEWKALYDYEEIAYSFPASPEYVTAIHREFAIAQRYLRGMRRKLFGIRWVGAEGQGVEMMIRVVERLPQTNLAQEAFVELAEYFQRRRDLASAALVAQKFEEHYPYSELTREMLFLRMVTNWTRFKGPRYNGAALIETAALAERYLDEYPTDQRRADVEAILVRVDNSAAEHMLEKAQWYLRRGDPSSARFTLRRLLRRHPQTSAAAEALQIMEQRGWSGSGEGER